MRILFTCCFLLISSTSSLIMVANITAAKGSTAERLLYGARSVNDKHAVTKKYIFATLLNCSNRDFGKNEKTLYLVVEMEFDGK